MKIAGLICGVLLTFAALIGAAVCFALPSLTNNRVSFDEALLGLVPAALVFFFGMILTAVFAFLVVKARKTAQRI